MTTDRKPTSGRGSKKSDLDSYQKASRSKAVGTNMRTFSRTKTSPFITTWDDDHFFTVLGNYFKFLGDVSGGVDSSTVGEAGALSLLDIMWEVVFENANIKDLVATDEASWKLYYLTALQVCLDIQIMYNFRCYLPAYTESDTVYGDSDAISYFTQSSFDILLASFKDYPIPKGIYNLVDIFATWVIKLTQEYELHTIRIPGAILSPFDCAYDLADFEAMRNLLRVNLGGMKTHAKKYGLGLSTWRDPVKPMEKTCSDPDVIAFFNHANFIVYDNQPVQFRVLPNGGFTGANLTTDYTLTQYLFKDNPNESPIHVLAPIFGTYNATNNIYGGWVRIAYANTAEYSISAKYVAQHGTAMTAASLNNDIISDLIIGLHKCCWDNLADTFHVNVTGTNLTADKGMDDVWPLMVQNALFVGTGRGATETNNDLINYLARALK